MVVTSVFHNNIMSLYLSLAILFLLHKIELRFYKECRDPNLITTPLWLLECSAHLVFTHSVTHVHTRLERVTYILSHYSKLLAQHFPSYHWY